MPIILEIITMRLSQSEEMSLAYRIDSDNKEFHAPISDIIRAIRSLERSGVKTSKIEKMVPKMLKNSEYRDNGMRDPRDSEILVYDVENERMKDMFRNPE